MKTEKIDAAIEKTKAKIAEYQARLKELERKKTEQENTEIVGLVRSVDMSPQELAEFVRARRERAENKQETEDTDNEAQ